MDPSLFDAAAEMTERCVEALGALECVKNPEGIACECHDAVARLQAATETLRSIATMTRDTAASTN